MDVSPIKPIISIDDLDKIDIGYADHITPILALPEKPVPSGTRAG